MAKLSHPRHGSLAFSPRKRARKLFFSAKARGDEGVLGFAGYKAGMTQVMAEDKHEKSPSFGQKIAIPCTIIECPAMNVFAIRFYKKTPKGLMCSGEVWAEKIHKNLARKTRVPKKHEKKDDKALVETASEIRLLVHTNPGFKKKPEVLEVYLGGDVQKAYETAKGLLGKEIKISDVFKDGDFIDIVAVTKGKGIQGPVKRWGTRIQYRKAHGKRRHTGALNPWSPTRTMWTALIAGQTGFHKRTEINKRVLKIGEEGKDVTPKGGITNYGVVKGNYILLKGSVAGAKKRLVTMRAAYRPQKKQRTPPEVKRVLGGASA